MEQKFKVGDRVFDAFLQEWGKVVDARNGITYPVKVILDSGEVRCYTAKGYFNESHKIRRLYYEEMVIVPKRTQQRVVQVREAEDHDWVERVLVKVLPSGEALCWIKAANLDEAKRTHLTDRWRYWRELPEKTKITRAEIAEKLGIDIDKLEITD